MTRDETKKIVAAVVQTYPNFKPENLSGMVDTWHMFLSDFDYESIKLALRAYVMSSNSGFAPSVSQLIGMLHKPKELSQMGEAEAWALACSAIRDGLYHSKENFDRLPKLVQEAVGSHEQIKAWAMMSEEDVESVVASNFKKAYKRAVDRDMEIAKMPGEMLAMIGQTANRVMIEEENNT